MKRVLAWVGEIHVYGGLGLVCWGGEVLWPGTGLLLAGGFLVYLGAFWRRT